MPKRNRSFFPARFRIFATRAESLFRNGQAGDLRCIQRGGLHQRFCGSIQRCPRCIRTPPIGRFAKGSWNTKLDKTIGAQRVTSICPRTKSATKRWKTHCKTNRKVTTSLPAIVLEVGCQVGQGLSEGRRDADHHRRWAQIREPDDRHQGAGENPAQARSADSCATPCERRLANRADAKRRIRTGFGGHRQRRNSGIGRRLRFPSKQVQPCYPGRRQPGSSFKPFIYSAALEKGFTPATIINDAPLTIDASETGSVNWQPRNFDGSFDGPIRMRTALTKSKNLVSIRISASHHAHICAGLPVALRI